MASPGIPNTFESVPEVDLPFGPAGKTFTLLKGIRVLDLTNSIAGPYATLQLADLGAEVVKVETPGSGDTSREWGPPFLDGISLWFLSVNRNKRSISLDYTKDKGRELLYSLAAAADVVVTNLRPAALRKFRLEYRDLVTLRKDLIYCSITGFGLTGARRELPCYDLIAEGYSGVMDLTGEPDNEPQKVGTPAADLLAGMDAAYAIVSALFDRQRSGSGHFIDVSLVESMTRFLAPRIVPFLGSGELLRRSGGKDSVIAIYQTFRTADELITLGLGTDGIFRRFCEAIGHSEWANDAEYADNAKRQARRAKLVASIQQALITQTRSHWLSLFEKCGVPAGPINRLDEVTRDPHLRRRGLFYRIPAAGAAIPQVGTGWQLDGEVNGYVSPPPSLGAETDQVLSTWTAMSTAEIERLRSEQII